MSDKKATLLPYWWMLQGSLVFAVMSELAHGLGRACDWQAIAFARSGLALLFTAGLALAGGVRLVLWRPRVLWARSLAGSVSLVCTFYALTRLPVSDVLTLTNTFPIWVACLSWPLLGEPPTGGVWVCVAMAVAGVALIQQPHLAEGNFASLLALASSLCTAVGMLGLHRLKGVDYRAVVVHFSGVSLLFCLGAWFLCGHQEVERNVSEGWKLWMLLGVGVSATAGQLCLTRAFAAGPPAKVSVVGLTQVLFTMLLDRALFGRHFEALTLLGFALVLAPTAWLLASGYLETV